MVEGLAIPCPAGVYGNSIGYFKSNCTAPCKPGTFCLIGSTNPTKCPQSYYCPDGARILKCPVDGYCPTGSILPEYTSNSEETSNTLLISASVVGGVLLVALYFFCCRANSSEEKPKEVNSTSNNPIEPKLSTVVSNAIILPASAGSAQNCYSPNDISELDEIAPISLSLVHIRSSNSLLPHSAAVKS